MRILVTGGTGFVGGSLLARLAKDNDKQVLALVRRDGVALPRGVLAVPFDSLYPCGLESLDKFLLEKVDVIIHCAAQSQAIRNASVDQLASHRKINIEWTLDLARESAAVGVKRFLFVSSIKANGETTRPNRPFKVTDTPAASDYYGQSKLEAEQGLMRIAGQSDLEVVVVRPPLVYGSGVKGNFASMIRWLKKDIPLPLGCLENNRRSLVGIDNLVDLLFACIDHPAAANKTFLVSDGEDLSTVDLLKRLGKALGIEARLIRIPPNLLMFIAKILGEEEMAQRLLGNLEVDISHTCQTLGWSPPVNVDEGFRRLAEHVS